MALLGSSRPLPGQSWGPDGTQKTPKSDPKIRPKMTPKREPVLGCSWNHFGVRFGAQNVCARGAHFSRCFSKIKTSLQTFVFFMLQSPLLALSWAHLGSFLASLGLILAPAWPPLASSWPHFGLILALLAVLGALLASSWPCLGPLSCTWPHLGPWVSWAPCWPTGAPS